MFWGFSKTPHPERSPLCVLALFPLPFERGEGRINVVIPGRAASANPEPIPDYRSYGMGPGSGSRLSGMTQYHCPRVVRGDQAIADEAIPPDALDGRAGKQGAKRGIVQHQQIGKWRGFQVLAGD
jgi:hypothetical protein